MHVTPGDSYPVDVSGAFGVEGCDNKQTSCTISNSGHGGGWTRAAAGPYSWFDRFSGPNELDAGQLGRAYSTCRCSSRPPRRPQVPLDSSVSDRRNIGR